ncbi:MAG: VPDSG-CTERM sorting domain-containing protein, partial [Chthoniobacterales bacterium]
DNQGGGDFFASSLFASYGIAQTKIGEYSDPYGGSASKAQNVSFVFNTGQLTALQGYLNSAGSSGWGNFGFGLDPDCHYFNNGVSFQITTSKTTTAVPEGGSAALLLAIGFASVLFLRRNLLA